MVVPTPPAQTVAPGAQFSIDLEYSASSAMVTGLGLGVFYDSTEVIFNGITDVFAFGFIAHHDSDGLQRPR